MLKSEIVYRELLESKEKRLSQLWLSKTLGFSLSTINNALKPLKEMGAVEILQRGLKLRDKEKILLYWASIRNLKKDLVYSTRAEMPPSEIEKSMPQGIVYTAFSAFKFMFKDVPADYSEVYVFSSEVEKVKKTFPAQKGPQNLFILKPDKRLFEISKENIAPASQIFADLWNVKEWYAKEFTKRLKDKIL